MSRQKKSAPPKREREAPMTKVGIKELKDRLSEYVHRAAAGERVIVTDRGRPIATLAPVDEDPARDWAWRMVRDGLAHWNGGKPRLSARPPINTGPSVSDAVLEDREDRDL